MSAIAVICWNSSMLGVCLLLLGRLVFMPPRAKHNTEMCCAEVPRWIVCLRGTKVGCSQYHIILDTIKGTSG